MYYLLIIKLKNMCSFKMCSFVDLKIFRKHEKYGWKT